MPGLLERPLAAPPIPSEATDERLARRSLQRQIERLEGELAQLMATAWERRVPNWTLVGEARSRIPRPLDLGGLEEQRDEMVRRAHLVRRALDERALVERSNRDHLEEMLREPRGHRWERITSADIGEPGCRNWHVLPRWGVLGMMLDWWRVRISSGCP